MMALRIPLQLGLRKNGVEAGDCALSSIWRRGISYPLNWLEVLLTAKHQDQIQTPFMDPASEARWSIAENGFK